VGLIAILPDVMLIATQCLASRLQVTLKHRGQIAMLWDAAKLKGYSIHARDGALGTVSDWLFHDDTWSLRWLVVDTGAWLPGRKVLLPLSALGTPNAELRQLPVILSKEQVKAGPGIDTDRTVSRQMEAGVFDYYALMPYWGAGYGTMSNAMAAPIVAPAHEPGTEPRDYIESDVSPRVGDPHLRSTKTVTGYHIHATDGMIGHVDDFIIDADAWRVRYLIVDTNNWLSGAQVLLSPRSIRDIDWATRSIDVSVSRDRVKHSPAYNRLMTVDGAYEQKFLEYYAMAGFYP
jgi:uncharacterized protein YrrD